MFGLEMNWMKSCLLVQDMKGWMKQMKNHVFGGWEMNEMKSYVFDCLYKKWRNEWSKWKIVCLGKILMKNQLSGQKWNKWKLIFGGNERMKNTKKMKIIYYHKSP